MAKSYYELLKHPKWQRKRLEILNRDNFECISCGSTETTLHVHHTYYEKGLAPWEYPDNTLQTLCENCHHDIEETKKNIRYHMGHLDEGDLERLLGYVLAIRAFDNPTLPIEINSLEAANGVSDFYQSTPPIILAALEDHKIDGYKLIDLIQVKKPPKD